MKCNFLISYDIKTAIDSHFYQYKNQNFICKLEHSGQTQRNVHTALKLNLRTEAIKPLALSANPQPCVWINNGYQDSFPIEMDYLPSTNDGIFYNITARCSLKFEFRSDRSDEWLYTHVYYYLKNLKVESVICNLHSAAQMDILLTFQGPRSEFKEYLERVQVKSDSILLRNLDGEPIPKNSITLHDPITV